MKVLETSFLVDYLNEQPYTIEYLEANPQSQYVVSTITLYELYAGALRSNDVETISTVTDALEWADPIAFDDDAAREAAEVRSGLLDQGEPIPAPDTLIVGVARALESELIATDKHFSRVSGIDVYNPR
ncbi:PIN domain-containing protein (plasmid) [Natrinema zhouii]|uniref:PIN domain-containing protein n=1 Tax=Natrinema zhouii TaxID=1710539 RepID=UPI001CFF7064|nr:PIN domain-containing protein [Natrinema zhouii]UHQ98660.1 PIN domain-containing protein [Natrinema zhouii]